MTNLALKGSQAPVAGLHVSLQIRLGVVGFTALGSHAAVDTGHQFGNDIMGHLITMGRPLHLDKNGIANRTRRGWKAGKYNNHCNRESGGCNANSTGNRQYRLGNCSSLTAISRPNDLFPIYIPYSNESYASLFPLPAPLHHRTPYPGPPQSHAPNAHLFRPNHHLAPSKTPPIQRENVCH